MSYSQKALDFLEDGNIEEFNKQYNLALHHDSDEMVYSLAEELYSYGFTNQAKELYEKLLKKFPDEDELRTDIADILISEGNTDEALEQLSKIGKDSPAYLQSLMVQADLYQTQELFEVSREKLLEAQKIEPDEDVITFALAELFYTMGEYNKAIPQYLTLIKKGIMNLSAVNLVERVGISYANDSNFENAIGYLKQIKTVDMSSDVKFETAFTYLQLKEYDQAIDIFKELRDSDPQYATLYPYLGQALEATNKIEDAYKVLQEGLSVDQYNEKLYLSTARAALKLSETDDALKYLQEGNKIDPDDIEIVLELSNLFVFREDFEENVKLLNTYIENHELDPQFYWNLAISYDKLDNLKLAHKNYLAAKPYFEDNADFLKEAALFFREYGDKDNSYELLSRYVKMQPNDEEAAFMLEEYLD
ncbi:MAG: tetratricopeptide repeat protein [Apilactobacillus sp.]|uniref:tetratricopeptide repeat protein n=1 Tax=Apilactobacillus sp. TaxID=2767901 RepID=UPI0025EFF86F|nr:tetratricopeptide repeat protein [Apilactobacillus sp.]MCT6822409.1 tetratricopeptide repeat protein [Apilactobacillus sp.]MCT6858609.1 tetratricopeptide repeat protein [Apilactobacillus sp.]